MRRWRRSEGALSPLAAAASGSVSANVEPCGVVDSSSSLPPIRSASRREIARPRPEPPTSRGVAWVNSSKMSLALCGAIPGPVSLTTNLNLRVIARDA